jgi:hypothetical protein
MTSLDSYYKKWEALAKSLSAADSDAAVPSALPPLDQIKPKDIGVTIGRPLSEEEFAAHQRRKGGAPSKVFSAPSAAPSQ